jgi:hypothetical protein
MMMMMMRKRRRGVEEGEEEGEDVFQRAFAVTKCFCLRNLMCFSTTNSNGED